MIQKIDFSPLGKAKRVLYKDRKQDKIWDTQNWKEVSLCSGESAVGARVMSSSVVMTTTATRDVAKVVNIRTVLRH
ncbi:MAG TPA: hypothetical protein DDY21_00180 [Candidatus Moranbacteria bacterium]|nr:hypothetical protein [Candidatus Moranbacteria bacterium]